jgi:small subunit ribosomal protein S21
MAKVAVYGSENLEKALKNFKRRCVREGIFRECRERQHYIKPSKKRREKRRKKK